MHPPTTESSAPTVGSLPLSEDLDVESTGRHLGGDAATDVLDATGIIKTYTRGVWPRRRRLDVLRGADLRLRSGEIVGLVGENGSGKSTLMKILVGGIERDGGTVSKSGSVGYCPQEPILYERLTCDEHFQLFGRAYGMNEIDVDSARDHIYRTLGFAEWRDSRVEELSGGTKAKLNLGLALLPDPDLLLLDEPYAGFDWDTYQRFWQLTRERRDAGRSLLIISHFITDAERFDRIYDLVEGKAVPR
ncbi:MAG TPA: ATP-binding cassette domain-containing protein [Acidimicrobiia bacterium]|nr:ATP-binding cassette domain-containing protein [Acidimicrobiia bacterium]